MELQWPLILFTTFMAWAAGLFGSQALAAAFGQAKKAQLTAVIASALLLAIGGVSVFFHLIHWERIFNGFGHLSSPITQELIAIAVFIVMVVVYFIFLRRSEDRTSVAKWVAWLAVIVSLALVVVVARSYLMAARPVWNSVTWITYSVGNSLLLGPATLAVIMAFKGDTDFKKVGIWALVAVVLGLVFAVVYAFSAQNAGSTFTNVGQYFDPTHPTKAIADIEAAVGDQSLLLWAVAVLVGAALPVIAAFFAWRKAGANTWKLCGTLIVICAIVGAIAMRVVFYNLGHSVFMFW